MTSIKIYPRLDFRKKNGHYPIYLRIIIDRKSRYYTLGCDIPEPLKYWNQQKHYISRFPGGDPLEIEEMNGRIEDRFLRAKSIIRNAEFHHIKLTHDEFEKQFIVKGSPNCFFSFAQGEIESLKKGKKSSETIRSYNSYVTKLRSFRPQLPFSDITRSFLESYSQHMQCTLQNNPNTVHKSLSFIRTMMKHARRDGIISNNPFIDYPLHRVNGKRDFLTIDELKNLSKIFRTSDKLNPGEKNVLKYFLFCCYTGLRYQDIKDLKYKHIKKKMSQGKDRYFIEISMHKTKETLSVPIPQPAVSLINFDGFKDQRVFSVRCNQITNRHLKKIAQDHEITKELTFHCSRHTFATMAITNKIPIEVVSKLLGHTNIKTTEIYAKITDDVKAEYISRIDNI